MGFVTVKMPGMDSWVDDTLFNTDEMQSPFFPLFQHAALGIGKANLEGRLLQVNPKLCEITGYSQGELLKMTIQDITHPDDLQADRVEVQGLMTEQKECYVREKRYIRKDGQISWVRLSVSLIRDASGKPDYLVALVEDINKRKVEEEKNRKLLDTLFENTLLGLHWLDPNGVILRANRTQLDMLGYKEEEYLGWNIEQFFLESEAVRELLKSVFQDKPVKSVTAHMRCKNGSYRKVLVSSNGYQEEGNTRYAYWMIKDITEYTDALYAAMESEERFRVIANAAPVLIAVADRHGDAVYFNQQWLDFIGTAESSLLRYNWVEYLHPDDRKPFYESYIDAFEARLPLCEECRIRRYDGVYRWMQVSATPRFALNGDFAGYASCTVDITELKQAEDRLHRIIDANLIGVLFWTKEGAVKEANDKFLQMIGYTREEMRQGVIDWRALTPPEFLHIDEAALKTMITTGSCEPFVKQYIHKDGHRIDILIGGAYFKGTLEEGVAVVMDISDQLKRESDLKKKIMELRKLIP